MILARHLLTKMRLDDPFLCWTPFPWPDPYTNRPSMVQMDQWIDGIPLSHFFCCLCYLYAVYLLPSSFILIHSPITSPDTRALYFVSPHIYHCKSVDSR